ncbi:MAG: hypothetical protein ACRDRX_08765, partial [Pseudonocardiaceae bacterium]
MRAERSAFPGDKRRRPGREFAAEVREGLVYKSLSTGVVTEQDEVRIIYTSRLTADDLDDDAIGLCCHLFQEWIPKAFD